MTVSLPAQNTYYNSTNFVQKTMKTLWSDYTIEMSQPWLSENGQLLRSDNSATAKFTNATWSIEYRKRWDGTNVHKNFAEDTMKCATCHTSHRASGDKLVNRKTELMLCTICHDGTGSYYNVMSGMIAQIDFQSTKISELERQEIENLARQVAASPEDPQGYVELGWAYFNAKDLQQAESMFHQALLLSANHIPALINLGILAAERNNYDAASEFFMKVIKVNPGHEVNWSNFRKKF